MIQNSSFHSKIYDFIDTKNPEKILKKIDERLMKNN
jgi:hypothetical protein